MKKAIFIIVALTLFTSLSAQVKVNKENLQVIPVNMEQNKCYTGFEQQVDLIPHPSSNKMIPSNDFYRTIGQTCYNLSTNGNARNTIGFKPKSMDGAAVWTNASTNTQSRGTGINYYKVNDNLWNPIPAPDERIETVRTGFGVHGFTQEGEVVVAHDAVNGLIVNTRDIAGQGSWQQATLYGPQYIYQGVPTTSILWPTMATHKNTVHVVCVTDAWPTPITYPPNYEPNPDVYPHGYLGFTTFPLYYRSTDGGKTWEEPMDFREYGMTNFECFRISADGYMLAVRGNHVVLLYNNQIGFVNYMESKDGGDTWVKKTVYDFGLEFDQSANVTPRLLPTTASVFIDEDHKVHVIFSTQFRSKNGGAIQAYTTPAGMIYWNDDKPPIDWHDLSYANNWGEHPGYIAMPSVLGFDKFYLWEGSPLYDMMQFNNFGWTPYPRILAKEGRVYVSYQSPLDYPLSFGSHFYRGIFITVSEDNGETWDVKNNTSWISYHSDFMLADWSFYSGPLYNQWGDPYWEGEIQRLCLSENAYPSMSYNYKGNLFMLQWYNDYYPFTQPAGTVSSPIDIFTFIQDLRNIPAYKNIQEVYKGWWDGPEPTIDFPPDACERPLELTGIYNGSDILLNWEEPDYISVPLLGYNVFLNGDKLNESPIEETHYVDTDLTLGTYHYSISAVYQNCESNLTYPVTIILLCETPVELSGSVYENDVTISWSLSENINGLLGYNIYRDGDMINESPITVREYIDEKLENGIYVYQVSAMYEYCESELSNGVSVAISVGINGFTAASFDIYPNPTTGNVTFEGTGLSRVEIFETQGRKLAGYENVNGILHLNVSQYQNGIYFVKMYSDNHQVVTKRLMILR